MYSLTAAASSSAPDQTASNLGVSPPEDQNPVLPQPAESMILQMAALDSLYTAILDAVGGCLEEEDETRLARAAEKDPCQDPSIQRTRELAAAFHRTMPNHWTAGFGTSLNGFCEARHLW